MSIDGCKRATVQFITWVRKNLHNDIFLSDFIQAMTG